MHHSGLGDQKDWYIWVFDQGEDIHNQPLTVASYFLCMAPNVFGFLSALTLLEKINSSIYIGIIVVL